MKQFDDAFLELYEIYETDVPVLTNAEKDTIYRKALAQVWPKRKGLRRSGRILLVAAVLITATLAIAATWYGVSDAFRGILQERNSDGEPGPVASMSPLVDSAGKLLGDKAESGGIEVSLRAVVGDEKIIKLLVDVTDLSGNGLAIRQPDGVLSTGDLFFDDIALQIIDHPEGYEGFEDRGRYRGNVSGGRSDKVIRGKPGDSKLTFLIEYDVSESFSVRDRKFRLYLYDLVQFATMNGSPSGMEPGKLYEVVSQFSGHTDSDFEVAGYNHNHETGETTYRYRLVRDGGKSLSLYGAAPDIKVTNAAIRKGVLYLRGTAGSFQEWAQLSHQAALVSESTGTVLRGRSEGEQIDEDGTVTWNIGFAGVSSAEELKDYVWMYDHGEGLYPLKRGLWEFEFTLDYENTTRSMEMNRAFQWERYGLIMKKVELSPFGLTLLFTSDAATFNEMIPTRDWDMYNENTRWEGSRHVVTVRMKDGVAITAVDPGGSSYLNQETGEGEFRLDYSFEAIIDPDKVAAVQIGDLEARLEDDGQHLSTGG